MNIDILKKMNRTSLINWLCKNDPNGVYKDSDSVREFGNKLKKSECIEIILNQIQN